MQTATSEGPNIEDTQTKIRQPSLLFDYFSYSYPKLTINSSNSISQTLSKPPLGEMSPPDTTVNCIDTNTILNTNNSKAFEEQANPLINYPNSKSIHGQFKLTKPRKLNRKHTTAPNQFFLKLSHRFKMTRSLNTIRSSRSLSR